MPIRYNKGVVIILSSDGVFSVTFLLVATHDVQFIADLRLLHSVGLHLVQHVARVIRDTYNRFLDSDLETS